jgi:hypothetical protein
MSNRVVGHHTRHFVVRHDAVYEGALLLDCDRCGIRDSARRLPDFTLRKTKVPSLQRGFVGTVI